MDTRRLILLMIFSFSLVMLWEAWQKQGQPQPQVPVKQEAGVAASAATGVPTPSIAAAPAAPVAVPAAAAPVTAAEKLTVKTDLYVADVSTQGGDLVRLELLHHKATEDKSRNFELLQEKGDHYYVAQSGLIGAGLPSHKTLYKAQPGARELAAGSDSLQLRLEAPAADGARVVKVLTFHRGSYAIDVAYEIANSAAAPLAAHAYYQLVRDDKAPAGDTKMLQTFTGPAFYTDADKYQKVDFSDVAAGKTKHAGKADNGWVAMVQHYFVSAWLPQGKGEREFYTKKLGEGQFAAGVILPVAVEAGKNATLSVPFYAGPQEQDKLKALATGFDLVVDYGWLTIIAAPLFWVLGWLHQMVGNWGWAIILLTIGIKLVFFPLSAASYKSMAKMRVLTPRLTQIKERCGDDRARMNQEMMELYRKEKINPLGGCLPVLVQIPVFIALYWVLLGSVEMRQAPWLGWIGDLSAADPYYILPVIMMASMLLQTRLNPTPPDPIQAKVMMVMPFFFGIMFFWFPSGLVLYWVVNNILSIAQQWQITRMIEAGKGAAANK